MSNLPAPPTRNPPKRSNPPPPPLTKAQKRAPIRPPSIPVQQQPEQQNSIEIHEKKQELIQQQKVISEQHEGQAITPKNKATNNFSHEQEKNIHINKESVNKVQQVEIPVYAAEQNYPKQDVLETQDLDGSNLNHPNIRQDTQKTGQPLVRQAPPPNLPKKTIPPPSRIGTNKKMGNAPRPPPPILKSKIESSQEIKQEENKYKNEDKQTKVNEQSLFKVNQGAASQTKNNTDEVKNLAQVLPNVNQNKDQKQMQTVPQVKRTIKTGPPPINTKKAPKVPQIPAYKEEKNMQLQSLKQSNNFSMIDAPTQKSAPQNELLSSIQSPTPNRQLYPPQSATLPSQQKNQSKMPEVFQPMSPTQQIQAILGASNLTPKYANLKNKLKDFSMKKQKLLESSSEDSNSQICSQTYSQMDAKRESNKGKDKQARGLYTVQSVKQAKWENDQKPILKQIRGEQLQNQFGNDRILRTESQDPTLRNFDKQQIQSQKNSLQRKLSEKKLPQPDKTIINKMPTSVIVGPVKKPPQKIQQMPNKLTQRQMQQQMAREQKEQQKEKKYQISTKQERYKGDEISYEQVEKLSQNAGNGIKSKIDERSRNKVIQELEEQNNQSPTKNIHEINDKMYLGSESDQQQIEFSNPILEHNQNENQSMNEDKQFKRPVIKPVPPPKKTGKRVIGSVPVPAPPAPRSILPTKNTEQTNLDSQKMRTQLEPFQSNNKIQLKSQASSHIEIEKVVAQQPATKAKPIQKQELISKQKQAAQQPSLVSQESPQKYSSIGTTSIDQMCRLLEQFRRGKQQYLRNAQQLSQLCECNRQKQSKKVLRVNQLLHRLEEQNIKLKSILTNS